METLLYNAIILCFDENIVNYGALDDPESYGITTEEDLMGYYENQNMTAVYVLQQYLGIWE